RGAPVRSRGCSSPAARAVSRRRSACLLLQAPYRRTILNFTRPAGRRWLTQPAASPCTIFSSQYRFMTQRPADTSSTHEPELPPALMVETRDALDGLPELLRSNTRLAVDTEANSLHAYQGRVCLIQLSTDTQDILIDPLVFEPSDLDFLGEVFADPQIEKVFHAAEYDVMILRRDFGFEFSNLFDTMIAARVLGWERFGLGTILEERYGVRVDISHQRADWGRRPLPPHLLRDARIDTHYLLDLRD